MSIAPKKQVALVGLSTLLTLFSLSAIVFFTNPQTASWATLSFFYLSLFLSCLGIFTLLGLGLRQFIKQNVYVINLSNSFRQAFLLAVLFLVSFFLASKQLLYWPVELSLVLFLVFIEIFLNFKI